MVATDEVALGGDKGGVKRSRSVGLKVATRPSTTRRVGRTCRNPACSKNPYFGWHGEKAVYCVTHKEQGMVDVKNKRCEAEGCMKRGLFGYDGERARFCGGHRLEGMVDLKNKRCKWVGCAKQANFAAEGKSTACFCSEHRSPGMIDVKGRRCEVVHCTKIAGYGVEGFPPSACLLHRGTGMVDMKQHRPRLGTGKAGGINVKVGNVAAGDDSSFVKWGKRSRKTDYGMPLTSAGQLHGDASGSRELPSSSAGGVDIMRAVRHSGASSSSAQQQQWYSETGYTSGISNQSGTQAVRSSWGGTQQQAGGGSSGGGVPTVGMWAFNSQAAGSPSARPAQNSGGDGGGGGLQHHHHHHSHWSSAHDTNGGSGANDTSSHYPGPHESGVLPAILVRNIPPLGGDGGGRSAGGGDGYPVAGRTGSAEGWRSSTAEGSHAAGEGFQHPFSAAASSSGVDQHGYGMMSSLGGGGDGGGSGASGRGTMGNGSSGATVKAEHGGNSEMAMGSEVEPEDVWLRDLMQGAIARENGSHQAGGGNGGGGSGALEGSHGSSGHAGGANSGGLQRSLVSHGGGAQHYPRHLALGSSSGEHSSYSRSGASSSAQREERLPFLQAPQHRQQQHHHHHSQRQATHGFSIGGGSQMSRLSQHESSMGGGRMKEASNGNPRSSSKGVSMTMSMGRSPSTASSGASPPHEPGSTTDAMPQRLYSKHDGVGGSASIASGGGGGNPGTGSSGGMSRTGARSAGPSNHLYMSLSASGYEGGYGMGMNADMQFLPTSRVSSPVWGGV